MTTVLFPNNFEIYNIKTKQFSSLKRLSHNYTPLVKNNFYRQPIWFHNLPLEILLKIFTYFSEKELRKTIMQVCQKWRYAALRPELWKSLKVIGKKISSYQIHYDISRFHYLECIVLNNIEEPRQILRQICRCLPNLKELTLKNCEEIPEKTLMNVLYTCKNLQKLNLSGTPFKGRKIFEAIPSLLHLKSLNLSKNPFLTIKKLVTCILNCYHLEEFRLSKWITSDELYKFDDEDICMILLNLARDLKSLTLDCSNLTNNSYNKILNCRSLQRLSLHRAMHLDGEIFSKLYFFFPDLQVLKIRNAPQISEHHIKQLFTNGKNVMMNLHSLNLSGCWQMTDKSLKFIVDCCVNLKSLCLQSCKSLTNFSPIIDSDLNLEFLNVAFIPHLNIEKACNMKLKTLVVDEQQEKELFEKLQNEVEVWVSVSEYKKNWRRMAM